MDDDAHEAGHAPEAGTAAEAGGDGEEYLAQVRRDIDEEVRRRRAAGDFPPSFERKLDELFARFTPTGTADDHFTEALKLADRSAYFDVKVPIGSRRTAKGAVRFVLWQAEAWFMNYVVTQLNHFSSSAMRVLHLLDERLQDVERDLELLVPPPWPDGQSTTAESSGDAMVTPFVDDIVRRFTPSRRGDEGDAARGTRSGSGAGARVLHAECGTGRLLQALAAGAVDAYGIDPGTSAADSAAAGGLDVRRDDVLGHLEAVGTETLSGVVLSGSVDRMTHAERRRLVRAVELAAAPGGSVVVVGTTPSAWYEASDPVAADLALGRPWHPETWAHLLGTVGFTDPEILRGPGADRLPRVPADQPVADVVNAAIDRIDAAWGEARPFAVFVTKRAGGLGADGLGAGQDAAGTRRR